MYVMHDYFTGTSGLYSSLLFGAVNDAEDLAISAAAFLPGVWLDPLFGSGDDLGRYSYVFR